jgi:hypothetical protein
MRVESLHYWLSCACFVLPRWWPTTQNSQLCKHLWCACRRVAAQTMRQGFAGDAFLRRMPDRGRHTDSCRRVQVGACVHAQTYEQTPLFTYPPVATDTASGVYWTTQRALCAWTGAATEKETNQEGTRPSLAQAGSDILKYTSAQRGTQTRRYTRQRRIETERQPRAERERATTAQTPRHSARTDTARNTDVRRQRPSDQEGREQCSEREAATHTDRQPDSRRATGAHIMCHTIPKERPTRHLNIRRRQSNEAHSEDSLRTLPRCSSMS